MEKDEQKKKELSKIHKKIVPRQNFNSKKNLLVYLFY